MALSRFVPLGFEDDLWRSLSSDLERVNQQMRGINDRYSSLVPTQPLDIGWNEAFKMDNPIVTDKDGNKKFHLEFDLRQFKPEEIQLTTANNMLNVEAKHEEKSDDRMSYREYRRQYTIPEGVDVKTLQSKLNHNGVLSIEAPVQQKQDVKIPIAHKWFVPLGFEDDLWRSLASDLERVNQQMRGLNDRYSSLVPTQPLDIGWNEAFKMDNPIVTDKDGNKKFHLEFDLRQFKPEEIQLTTANNMLNVEAKHEEKSDDRMSYREYRRQYTIPEGVDVKTLQSKLGHNGVLSIEAPVQQKQDVKIPIAHK
ncbi:uncharacterized protein LOC135480801 [Liolophura sinensis]|uniref:uncharacterized protein LOC135480801 n=1 Tax=Liolophura sinensis TaxID=3198878 RepID=UPI003158A679